MKIWHNIEGRCNDPRVNKFDYYGGRGIKNYLTPNDLSLLWNRDEAINMKQPSIDRINGDDHYMMRNCRFIEMDENRRRPRNNRRVALLKRAQRIIDAQEMVK